jgi:hypothetical protein
MTEALMREGLAHEYAGIGHEKFFQLIDATGGWPLGYSYVGFEHTDSRKAGFTKQHVHHGWWTTVAHVDDYYLWKLSPAALQRIADAVRDRIVMSHPNAANLSIKNWRGHTAALAKGPSK